MVTLLDLYKKGFTFSFEIFPPKTTQGEENLWRELEILKVANPGYISVTYGAGGSTQEKTLAIADKIMNDFAITPVVHFTCVGANRQQIKNYIEKVSLMNIHNILALRGDPPLGETNFSPPPDGFSHANELVEYIRGINQFTIVVAGYPEGHIDAPDLDTDIYYLKKKVDAGADLIVSQLFYNNDDYYTFIDKVQKIGIRVPVVPGIMPVTNPAQIKRITSMCGAKIPPQLASRLNSCGSDEDVCKTGIEYSINQCRELKSWGVPGFHFYTLNKASAVMKIIEAI